MSRKRKIHIILPDPSLETEPKKIKFEGDVKTLKDLIDICDSGNEYININISKLKLSRPELVELNDMIGLKELKTTVMDQLLYYMQSLHKYSDDYLHTIISGSPGSGKTTIAKILGRMFSKLEILSKDIFKVARRDNLIGGYLGQTALKTQALLDSCKGGVLFIDEIYSLGNKEGKDSYSKECIDTINLFLSENKENFMLIVAGYEEEIENCFFNYNAGLKRRFMWHHKIKNYDHENLADMFNKMIKEKRWKIHEDISREYLIDFFKKNMSRFSNYGGDVEKFFTYTKISHSKRVFSLPKDIKKIITKEDLEKGLKRMEEKKKDEPPPGMYI